MSPSFFSLALLSADTPWMLSFWVLGSVLLCVLGFGLNLFGLAGNWLIVATAGLHFWMVDRELRVGYQPGLLILLLLLAVSGEGLEALSGVLGAGKAGGSRRAMLLSVAGGMLGSIFGFGMGNAVLPILGGILGIVLIGGVGSLLGAMLGESWKGSARDKTLEVGKGAFWGKILGTLAKSLIGTLMLLFALGGLIFQ